MAEDCGKATEYTAVCTAGYTCRGQELSWVQQEEKGGVCAAAAKGQGGALVRGEVPSDGGYFRVCSMV